ncbi:MAG: hypothetical protein EZS28_032604, partial [Streblomastix strix]
KTEVDTLLDDKLNLSDQFDAYSKQIDDVLLFISEQNKNDASIPLIGGGYMLVSSLISQPQLQEVRDIASGKSNGYVFATTDEMNTWMEDQENVAKLAI